MHFHSWNLEIDRGVNRYFECRTCGDRKVESFKGCYQPIDRKWLNAESDGKKAFVKGARIVR